MTYKTFEPQTEVLRLYRTLGGWRAVAAYVGAYSPAYWSCVAKGMRPSRAAENALRRRLGVAPRGVTRIADLATADLAWYLNHRSVIYGD
jgi:hypothetical protein